MGVETVCARNRAGLARVAAAIAVMAVRQVMLDG